MRWVLGRQVGVRPGLETRDPAEAAERYRRALASTGRSLEGSEVLVLGYGGRFSLAVELLRRGARHVTLVDPYAKPDETANRALVEESSLYLTLAEDRVHANPDWITVFHQPVEALAAAGHRRVDVILSWSVFEHLGDVEAITEALAALTKPDGCNLHFIDLRDHYFKYPFEMLCYTEAVWRRFLNPGSNLNRLRLWDYESAFARHFGEVSLQVLESAPAALERWRARIRPEFLSGDLQRDAATRLLVSASRPLSPGRQPPG